MFINFETWSRSFLKLRQNFFDKIVKTSFYVSNKTFCRKKFIQEFQNLREIFRDFGQETRLTLSSFQNCTQRVEREFDRNSLGTFFSFSRVSPLDTSSLEIFQVKRYFMRKIIIFTVFGRWPNSIYVSRGRFCLEILF